MTFDGAKSFVEFGQAALTSLAILVGGGWAFYRFVWTRERHARAELEHSIFVKSLGVGKLLIRVSVTMRNKGIVLLRWNDASVRLQLMLPCPSETLNWLEQQLNVDGRRESEADWPIIKETSIKGGIMEIESGESDTAHADFIVADDVDTFLVYSHVGNTEKRSIGWNHTTVHEARCHKELKNV